MLAAGTFGLDRLTKAEVLAGVQPGERIVVLPWLSIADVQNAGGAYGFGQAATLLWLGASLVVGAGIILYVLRRPIGLPSGLALGLVLGGTLGNGYSRLVNGSVTDFLALAGWPVFNVADLAVVAGVVLLLLRWRRNGRRAR